MARPESAPPIFAGLCLLGARASCPRRCLTRPESALPISAPLSRPLNFAICHLWTFASIIFVDNCSICRFTANCTRSPCVPVSLRLCVPVSLHEKQTLCSSRIVSVEDMRDMRDMRPSRLSRMSRPSSNYRRRSSPVPPVPPVLETIGVARPPRRASCGYCGVKVFVLGLCPFARLSPQFFFFSPA